jgi:hypothetical protein
VLAANVKWSARSQYTSRFSNTSKLARLVLTLHNLQAGFVAKLAGSVILRALTNTGEIGIDKSPVVGRLDIVISAPVQPHHQHHVASSFGFLHNGSADVVAVDTGNTGDDYTTVPPKRKLVIRYF